VEPYFLDPPGVFPDCAVGIGFKGIDCHVDAGREEVVEPIEPDTKSEKTGR
jgi:hypothetical protein